MQPCIIFNSVYVELITCLSFSLGYKIDKANTICYSNRIYIKEDRDKFPSSSNQEHKLRPPVCLILIFLSRARIHVKVRRTNLKPQFPIELTRVLTLNLKKKYIFPWI